MTPDSEYKWTNEQRERLIAYRGAIKCGVYTDELKAGEPIEPPESDTLNSLSLADQQWLARMNGEL